MSVVALFAEHADSAAASYVQLVLCYTMLKNANAGTVRVSCFRGDCLRLLVGMQLTRTAAFALACGEGPVYR